MTLVESAPVRPLDGYARPQHPATRLAHHTDIPGTRAGPEDGSWPCPYHLLPHRDACDALRLVSNVKRVELGPAQGAEAKQRRRHVDSVSFQPFPGYQTQDRHVVEQLDVHGETWTMSAVFDGHLGGSTVAHTAHHMPIIIRDFLRDECVNGTKSTDLSPTRVSEILSKSMSSFDDAIAADVVNIFPGGIDALDDYSDEEIRRVLNDHDRGGENYQKVRLSMHGTTALVALVDPAHRNLWIANLGDCEAVLVTPGANGKWDAQLLTTAQNGDNHAEIERVRSEHPGEAESVMDGRVLGALAPTRSIGDIPFKQPPIFTRRILYNLEPGFRDHSAWEAFLERNLTPPYITAEPDVIQHALPSSPPTSPSAGATSSPELSPSSSPTSFPFFRLPAAASAIANNLFGNGVLGNGTARPAKPRRASLSASTQSGRKGISTAPARRSSFLILASDGLSDLYHGRAKSKQDMANQWADAVVRAALSYSTAEPASAPAPPPEPQTRRHKFFFDGPRSPTSPGTTTSSSTPPSSFPSSLPITIKKRRLSGSRAPPIPAAPADPVVEERENLALALLRVAIGGEDADGLSRMLTLQMGEPWIDDTTIVVQAL